MCNDLQLMFCRFFDLLLLISSNIEENLDWVLDNYCPPLWIYEDMCFEGLFFLNGIALLNLA